MNLELYIVFLLVSAGVILTPGPNVLLIVSNSISYGARTGLRTVVGTSSAMALQLFVAAFGVTSILRARSSA